MRWNFSGGTFSVTILANGGQDTLIPPGGTFAVELGAASLALHAQPQIFFRRPLSQEPPRRCLSLPLVAAPRRHSVNSNLVAAELIIALLSVSGAACVQI